MVSSWTGAAPDPWLEGGLSTAGRSARTLGLATAATDPQLMFDHVVFGVSNCEVSKTFLLKVLEPLGVAVVSEGPLGIELCRPSENTSLCIRRELEPGPARLHLAFQAESPQPVDAFYRAALAAGAMDNGAPGLRAQYHARCCAAFVIGPDGHNIEAVCHKPAGQPRRCSATPRMQCAAGEA